MEVKKCPLQSVYKTIPTTGRKTKAKSHAKRRPDSFLSKKSTNMMKIRFNAFATSVKILKNVEIGVFKIRLSLINGYK